MFSHRHVVAAQGGLTLFEDKMLCLYDLKSLFTQWACPFSGRSSQAPRRLLPQAGPSVDACTGFPASRSMRQLLLLILGSLLIELPFNSFALHAASRPAMRPNTASVGKPDLSGDSKAKKLPLISPMPHNPAWASLRCSERVQLLLFSGRRRLT